MAFFRAPDVQDLKLKNNVKKLIKALAYKKDDSIRKEAVEALGVIGDSRAVEPIIELLKDENQEMRRKAAEALGAIGSLNAIAPLSAVIESKNNYWIHDTALEALIKTGDDQAAEPVLRHLQRDSNSRVIEVAEAILQSKESSATIQTAAGLYWISKSKWDRCLELGDSIIPLLERVIRANSVSDYTRSETAKTLGRNGAEGLNALTTLLQDHDGGVRKAALTGLNDAGWTPETPEEKAAFCISTGDVSWLGRMSVKTTLPLLIQSLDWPAEQDDWFIQGWIVKLLLRPETHADNVILKRANDVLEEHAIQYEKLLSGLVNSPRSEQRPKNDSGPFVFGEYSSLVFAATSYERHKMSHGVRNAIKYDVESSIAAVKDITQIQSPTSNNLLIHLSQIQDVKVVTGSSEVQYSQENVSGTSHSTGKLSFKRQRDMAAKELVRRGSPKYDSSVYKEENCWSIPKNR
ncbi:hypothetical protein BVY01_01070 [bacterium I07]|nr:hypothetical protein BVY01_01070 [bacterium I07]